MAKVTVLFGTNVEAEYTLEKDQHRIGRSMDCDIVVDNLGVSRHHCTIQRDGANWALIDGGSNNGTYVGGQKITRHVLKDGDKIILGKHSLIYDGKAVANPGKQLKKGPGAMGGEMTMFVDQAALAKALTADGKRMVLSLAQGGREVLVQLRDEMTIGTNADVPAKGFLVKAVQAKISRSTVGHKVSALPGWRAVKVNGTKLTGDRELRAGDRITIAGTTITYKQA